MQPPPPDANTFRIFVSTDNHLGFGEDSKYPPRADDSFRAVEEVLTNAKKYEARTPFPSFRRSMHFPCCLTPCKMCLCNLQRNFAEGRQRQGYICRSTAGALAFLALKSFWGGAHAQS